MDKRPLVFLLSVTLILLVLNGSLAASEEIIKGTGTIRYIPLEGGFYGIVGDDGKNYDPVNLKEEFRKDGLRVRFEAKVRKDLVSFHMWGRLVEIIRIERE